MNPDVTPPVDATNLAAASDLSIWGLFIEADIVVKLVMVGLLVLFRYTSLGLKMRAAAFDPMVARLQGVRVERGPAPRVPGPALGHNRSLTGVDPVRIGSAGCTDMVC